MTFAAHTAEALSRWAGEAMETLGRERDRAHALHRENAQVSREATLAQKEIMSLEAKIFHTRKEVRWSRFLEIISLRYPTPENNRCSGFLNIRRPGHKLCTAFGLDGVPDVDFHGHGAAEEDEPSDPEFTERRCL